MIVKKTCMKRLTALTTTLNKYSHASPTDQQTFRGHGPVIVAVWIQAGYAGRRFDEEAGDEVGELMALLAVMTKLCFLGFRVGCGPVDYRTRRDDPRWGLIFRGMTRSRLRKLRLVVLYLLAWRLIYRDEILCFSGYWLVPD